MSLPRGEIFIGDLVRAYTQIGAGDRETAEAVASMLGFTLSGEEPARGQAGAAGAAQTMTRADKLGRGRLGETQAAQPERPRLPPRREGPLRKYPQTSFVAAREDEPTIEFEHWHEEPLRASVDGTHSDWPSWAGAAGAAALPHESLLHLRWTRGILGEALATPREGRTPDILKAVEVIARGDDLARLPMLKVPTIARGCQVLCDVSHGMMPFTKDRREILDAVRSVVGHELVEVYYFEDCPVYGVEREENLEFVPYEPPPPETPVLIISDLGVAESPYSMRRSSPGEWLGLLDILRGAGCPVLALAPYPPSRWPASLVGRLRIVQWDRRTTVAAVRHTRERG